MILHLRFCSMLVPFLIALNASPAGAQHSDAAATLIVMDGSGSMWGQIEGRPKLEAARETAAKVLSALPSDRVLGLLAYGHRERGNCGDIELMVTPAPGTAPAVLGAINSMRFQGKTPLTEAVRQAAAALRSTEMSATVVLITDGIETCEADPCALSAELEATGVDFTAHVIGFGLSRDEGAAVACIAENTGGRYLPASDAASLAEALEQAVSTAPPPPAALEQPAEPERPSHYPGDVWMQGFAIAPSGKTFGEDHARIPDLDFPSDAPAEACRASCDGDPNCGSWRYEPKGSYFIDRARCFRFQPGVEFWETVYPEADGFVSGMKEGVIGLTTPYIPLGGAVEVRLVVPEKVEPGQEFTVLWSGPGGAKDWVGLAPEGQGDVHGDTTWFYVMDTIEQGDRPEGAGVLTAPAEAGIYDLRYVLGRDADRRVIFTMPLGVGIDTDGAPRPELIGAEVRFTVPESYSGEVISWSAVPRSPDPAAPEAAASPEAISGAWETQLYPGKWWIEGMAESGMYFAAEIEITKEPQQSYEIPAGFETEGMGEERAEDAHTEGADPQEPAFTFNLPDGWHLSEIFYAETAAGVRADQPTATFVGPEGRFLLLNPLQWSETLGRCEPVSYGQLCLMGRETPGIAETRAAILAGLDAALGPAPQASPAAEFKGTLITPEGDVPLSTFVPGWSAQ